MIPTEREIELELSESTSEALYLLDELANKHKYLQYTFNPAMAYTAARRMDIDGELMQSYCTYHNVDNVEDYCVKKSIDLAMGSRSLVEMRILAYVHDVASAIKQFGTNDNPIGVGGTREVRTLDTINTITGKHPYLDYDLQAIYERTKDESRYYVEGLAGGYERGNGKLGEEILRLQESISECITYGEMSADLSALSIITREAKMYVDNHKGEGVIH